MNSITANIGEAPTALQTKIDQEEYFINIASMLARFNQELTELEFNDTGVFATYTDITTGEREVVSLATAGPVH